MVKVKVFPTYKMSGKRLFPEAQAIGGPSRVANSCRCILKHLSFAWPWPSPKKLTRKVWMSTAAISSKSSGILKSLSMSSLTLTGCVFFFAWTHNRFLSNQQLALHFIAHHTRRNNKCLPSNWRKYTKAIKRTTMHSSSLVIRNYPESMVEYHEMKHSE